MGSAAKPSSSLSPHLEGHGAGNGASGRMHRCRAPGGSPLWQREGQSDPVRNADALDWEAARKPAQPENLKIPQRGAKFTDRRQRGAGKFELLQLGHPLTQSPERHMCLRDTHGDGPAVKGRARKARSCKLPFFPRMRWGLTVEFPSIAAAAAGLTESTVICKKVAVLRSVVPESTASCSSVIEADTKASSSSNHSSCIALVYLPRNGGSFVFAFTARLFQPQAGRRNATGSHGGIGRIRGSGGVHRPAGLCECEEP
eukprot:scaffold4394_cov113-Isochrysis_galbana.AAC.3